MKIIREHINFSSMIFTQSKMLDSKVVVVIKLLIITIILIKFDF